MTNSDSRVATEVLGGIDGKTYVRLNVRCKELRAKVVSKHVQEVGYPGVVCFSCGNAANFLRCEGLDVLEIGPRGDLLPGKWWSVSDIAMHFGHLFDATSGHLPVELMNRVALLLRDKVLSEYGPLKKGTNYVIPSGSGETLVCMCLAFPGIRFIAEYDNSKMQTTYSENAPLNGLVELLAYQVRR